jgi:hypothetical protein
MKYRPTMTREKKRMMELPTNAGSEDPAYI